MNRVFKICFICFFSLIGLAFSLEGELEWEENETIEEAESKEDASMGELGDDIEELIKTLEETTGKSSGSIGEKSSVIDFSLLPHKFLGGINDIVLEHNRGDSFYIAGEDGFVTRCSYPSFATETWQLSHLAIKKIASHPDGRTIALYESDGKGIHKISVWKWKEKKRVFILRPNYFVTSISWSANGSYLFVGNTEKGIDVFDKTGKIVDIYSTPPGIVLLSTTGKREKSIVTYGKGGKLTYTSLATRKKLAEYQTYADLENPRMIKNFTRMIGFKADKIYVINATTGEMIEEYKTGNAIFITEADYDSPAWIEKVNKKNKYVLHNDKGVSSPFVLPTSITSGVSIMGSVIVGGIDGKIYVVNKEQDNQNKINSFCPCEYKDSDMKNLASNNSFLFLLKNKALLLQKDYNEEAIVLRENIDATSLISSNDFVLLWSNNEKKPIYKYSINEKNMSVLYKARSPILSCSILNGKLTVVEASGFISLVDIESGKSIFSTSITGTQNAVQRGELHMIIAKNSLDSSKAPLFELNMATKETTPIRLEGELAFSLTPNEELNNTFFCFLLTSNENISTNLIKFVVDENRALSGKFENLLSYNDEDFASFVLSYKNALITNLGKENLIYFNLFSKESFKMERDYALPKTASLFKDYIVSMNTDGSLTWYDKNTLKVISYTR